jgi:hypothetical protein
VEGKADNVVVVEWTVKTTIMRTGKSNRKREEAQR